MSQAAKTVVVGLGNTGLSCARFLLQQGVAVAVTDSRENPPGLDLLLEKYPGVEVSIGAFDLSLMISANEIVISPGVSLQESAVQEAIAAGISVVGDIELFCRYIRQKGFFDTNNLPVEKSAAKVIAITGSNAKSTVTTLVGEMIQQAGHSVIVAGNIGLPVMDVLLQGESAEFYVLELSSFQLETTYDLQADVATILNISPDHLDRYDGLQEYISAKQCIYQDCNIAVVNNEDKATFPEIKNYQQLMTFMEGATKNSIDPVYQKQIIEGQEVICRQDIPVVAVNDMALAGGHNVKNALAALTLGHAVGLEDEDMAITLSGFSGLDHRCQVVAEFNHVTWINDSKGTNTGATIAAIDGLSQVHSGGIVLIAGGVGKGADFSELVNVAKQHVSAAVLIGEAAPLIAKALKNVCKIVNADSLTSAVKQSQKLAIKGGVVLLSPACASFDMFAGYEDRGNQFIDMVNQLADSPLCHGEAHDG